MRPLIAACIASLALPALGAAIEPPPPTVSVSPAFPSSADGLDFAVSVCLPPTYLIDPPVVAGSTITLTIHFDGPIPPVICVQHPPPQHVSLGPIPVGSYTAEVRFGEQLLAATAFDVQADTKALFLRGRFRAEAFWTGADGVEHPAGAAQVSDESGAFWFFDAGSAELTMKVLDGRGVNGHFWVFIGALTNVAWHVSVTDTAIVCFTAPCGQKSYSVPAGQTHNVIDLQAY
ncbi:MAG: hypothetical protein ABI609_08370 [Acidobacteriota bacterium]